MKVRRVDQGGSPVQDPCPVMAGILFDVPPGTRKASAEVFNIVRRSFIAPSWPPTRGDGTC